MTNEYLTGTPMESVKYSGGLIGLDDVTEENKQLRARITELETVAQWHDASEPPEDLRHILILTKHNGWVKGNYRNAYAPAVRWWYLSCNVPIIAEHVLGWRDLPPMPEVEA